MEHADPVQFRLRNLVLEKERATEVLLAAAKQAGWQERPSPARGSRFTTMVLLCSPSFSSLKDRDGSKPPSSSTPS